MKRVDTPELREARIQYAREYRKKNPEAERARKRAWRARNPEKAKAISDRQRAKDPEKAKQARKNSYQRHRKKELAANKARRLADPEAYKDMIRRYLATDAGRQMKLYAANRRRARLLDNKSPGVTPKEWSEVLEFFGYLCAYCLTPAKKFERDHVIPISRGGRDSPDNVVPACMPCNRQKNTKLVAVWYCEKRAA